MGVVSFAQIRTWVLEKLVGFFEDLLRIPSSIPFRVHGLISEAKENGRCTLRLFFSCKLPVCVVACLKLYEWVK